MFLGLAVFVYDIWDLLAVACFTVIAVVALLAWLRDKLK
jgi:hypothetical protein